MSWYWLSRNKFNQHSYIKKKKLKEYSLCLIKEIPTKWEEYEIKRYKNLYESCLDMLKLRIRDINMGLRNSMI